jgi:hypothetical protein
MRGLGVLVSDCTRTTCPKSLLPVPDQRQADLLILRLLLADLQHYWLAAWGERHAPIADGCFVLPVPVGRGAARTTPERICDRVWGTHTEFMIEV